MEEESGRGLILGPILQLPGVEDNHGPGKDSNVYYPD
jgi:hypothetical protein